MSLPLQKGDLYGNNIFDSRKSKDVLSNVL